jgi:hypothetical protein
VLDRTRWTDEEWMVLSEYGFRCVLCGFQPAVTLHHEPPRSLNPNWKNEPWTQFPLCDVHHDMVTGMSRYEAEELLLRHEYIYARGAIERIKSRVPLRSE